LIEIWAWWFCSRGDLGLSTWKIRSMWMLISCEEF